MTKIERAKKKSEKLERIVTAYDKFKNYINNYHKHPDGYQVMVLLYGL
jgi:hypothetical protein